jgi:hypothetical protein
MVPPRVVGGCIYKDIIVGMRRNAMEIEGNKILIAQFHRLEK